MTWLPGPMVSRKLDFIIAGTQKGGTSALDYYLRQHPQFCMGLKKEIHFFDHDEHFPAGGVPDYARYHRFFAPRPGQTLIGEATPVYMYWRDAPRRMQEYNPALKLIFVLRDPIMRAYSHWNMQRQKARDFLPFWLAIRTEAERCRPSLPLQSRHFSYIDRGRYAEQLERIWAHFPRAQTLVLRQEALKAAPKDEVNRVCAFLGAAPVASVQAESVNSRPYLKPIASADWRYLRDQLEPDIRALETALGWDCADWLREPAGGQQEGAPQPGIAAGGRLASQ